MINENDRKFVTKLKKITQTIKNIKVEYISEGVCNGCDYKFVGTHLWGFGGRTAEIPVYLSDNGNMFCDDCIYYMKDYGIQHSESCRTCELFFHSRNTLFEHLEKYNHYTDNMKD